MSDDRLGKILELLSSAAKTAQAGSRGWCDCGTWSSFSDIGDDVEEAITITKQLIGEASDDG